MGKAVAPLDRWNFNKISIKKTNTPSTLYTFLHHLSAPLKKIYLVLRTNFVYSSKAIQGDHLKLI